MSRKASRKASGKPGVIPDSPIVLTPNPHALQHELSYQVPNLNLEPSLSTVNKEVHEVMARPRVFVRTPKGELCPARYGMDMFHQAHILSDRPLVVVEQDEETADVIISAVQTIDWSTILRRQLRNNGEVDADEASESSSIEDDVGSVVTSRSLRIVPAGSFSYRKTWLGQAVRTLMGLYRLYQSPSQMCGYMPPHVRLAAVVIPRVMYKGRQHLMITQRVTRKKHGTYNGMWVFPGGHVEAGETVEQGAAREFSEETGLQLHESSFKLQCCWQEVMATRQIQFLMIVFSADVVSPSGGEFDWSDLAAQTAEVATVALLPEELWRQVTTRSDCNATVDGLSINGTEESKFVSVPANDITGHHKGIGQGIGSGHKYALEQFLDPFDKHIALAPKKSRLNGRRASLANIASHLSRNTMFRKASNLSSDSSSESTTGEQERSSIKTSSSFNPENRSSYQKRQSARIHNVHSLVVAQGGDIIRMSPDLSVISAGDGLEGDDFKLEK